jgi:hypothetical protein
MSLYIPRVFINITEERIMNIFWKLNIGKVSRADFVLKDGKSGQYYSVFVHFEYWFMNSTAAHLQERILDPNQDAKIVYDEPWYWVVLQNNTAASASASPDAIPLGYESVAHTGKKNMYRKPKLCIDLGEKNSISMNDVKENEKDAGSYNYPSPSHSPSPLVCRQWLDFVDALLNEEISYAYGYDATENRFEAWNNYCKFNGLISWNEEDLKWWWVPTRGRCIPDVTTVGRSLDRPMSIEEAKLRMTEINKVMAFFEDCYCDDSEPTLSEVNVYRNLSRECEYLRKAIQLVEGNEDEELAEFLKHTEEQDLYEEDRYILDTMNPNHWLTREEAKQRVEFLKNELNCWEINNHSSCDRQCIENLEDEINGLEEAICYPNPKFVLDDFVEQLYQEMDQAQAEWQLDNCAFTVMAAGAEENV